VRSCSSPASAHAHGDVDALVHQVHLPVVENELDLEIGVLGQDSDSLGMTWRRPKQIEVDTRSFPDRPHPLPRAARTASSASSTVRLARS